MMSNEHIYPAVQGSDTLAESVRAYKGSVDSYQPVRGLAYNETGSAETSLFYLTPKKPVNELEALKARYERESSEHIRSQYATEIDILEREFFSEYDSIDDGLVIRKSDDLPSELEERVIHPGKRVFTSGGLTFGLSVGLAIALHSGVAFWGGLCASFLTGLGAGGIAEHSTKSVVEDVKEIRSWRSQRVDVPPDDRTWRSYDFTRNSYKASTELKTGVLDTCREASPDVERTMPSRPAVKNRG